MPNNLRTSNHLCFMLLSCSDSKSCIITPL